MISSQAKKKVKSLKIALMKRSIGKQDIRLQRKKMENQDMIHPYPFEVVIVYTGQNQRRVLFIARYG